MISGLIGRNKPAVYPGSTQMTTNFARYVLKNPTRVRLLTCDSNQLGVVTKLNQENVRKNLAEKFLGVCNLDQHIYRVTPSIQLLEKNCTSLLQLSDLKSIKSNKALVVPMAFLLVAWLLLVFQQGCLQFLSSI